MDEILKPIFELFCHKTGKFISSLLFPRIKVEKSIHENKFSWKLTYKKKGTRYFYEETLTLIGLLLWMTVGAIIIVANK